MGYCVYGKKQRSIVPMVGGMLMLTASYFASSAWTMSAICLALAVAVYYLVRQGY